MASIRRKPSSTSFVVNSRSPTALWVFKVVVFALVSGDSTFWVFFGRGFVKGAEHAAGVARFINKLELEGEDEVFIFGFGTKEGVAFDVFSEAANGVVLDFEFGGATGFTPAGEVLTVEEGFELVFEIGGFEKSWENGAFAVMFGEGG